MTVKTIKHQCGTCDFCGCCYKEEPVWEVVVKPSYGGRTDFQVCRKCAAELIAALKEGVFMRKPKDKTVEKLRKQYLRNKGQTCPYCGSGSLNSEGSGYEGNVVLLEVTCTRCKRSWTDVARVVDVTLEPPKCDGCSGENTAKQCKCGQWLCQDCEGTHVCEGE